MKSQMKSAGRSGARVAVIVGEQEAADGTATVRDLGRGEQEIVPPRPGGRAGPQGSGGPLTEYAPAWGLRTHWCGELRPDPHRADRVGLRLGGAPARAR